jgi:methyl-accepting chemotaxis protein
VTDEYRGDFDTLKRNWNAVAESTRMRSEDLGKLMQAALEGRLEVRADASRYRGYNGKLVASMNGILDAVAAPLEEAASVLERLAARDLTARMTGTYAGDHARIQEALNGPAEALHQAIGKVAASTAQVTSAAAQIAASSQAVAAGASEQASSLEETSAQLEALTAMVKGSADNAQQASALAQTARAAASQGSDAMGDMGSAALRSGWAGGRGEGLTATPPGVRHWAPP